MFSPIDLTNSDFLFDVIISHQRRLEALETGGTQLTDIQQLKTKIIACIERYLVAINQPVCKVELSDFIKELRQLF